MPRWLVWKHMVRLTVSVTFTGWGAGVFAIVPETTASRARILEAFNSIIGSGLLENVLSLRC